MQWTVKWAWTVLHKHLLFHMECRHLYLKIISVGKPLFFLLPMKDHNDVGSDSILTSIEAIQCLHCGKKHKCGKLLTLAYLKFMYQVTLK